MRPGMRLAIVGVLCAVTAPRSARAETDETEKRLKAAGVDDALRDQVHTAINKGVEFLLKRQRKQGSFRELTSSDMQTWEGGITLLCALALRHAGGPTTSAAVARAVEWTLDAASPARFGLSQVYAGSLALMLLASVPGHDEDAKRIADTLVRGQNSGSGWWSYFAGFDAKPDPYDGDLSNSQFAILGLRAAERRGIEIPVDVWRRHAESLCAHQTPLGSWTYSIEKPAVPKKGAKPAPPPAPREGGEVETMMGLANLLISKAALEKANTKSPGLLSAELASRIRNAVERGRTALNRHGSQMLADLPAHGHDGLSQVGWDDYYDLFSLEKACIFADVETIGTPPSYWYAAGAAWLVSVQHKDGGWDGYANAKKGRGSEIDTALALLFLERSVSVLHPTTPSEPAAVPAKPAAPVTPAPPAMTDDPPMPAPPAMEK
jgi:hypothetical protein